MLSTSTGSAGAARMPSYRSAGYAGVSSTGFITATARFTVPYFTCAPSGVGRSDIFVTWKVTEFPFIFAEARVIADCNNGVRSVRIDPFIEADVEYLIGTSLSGVDSFDVIAATFIAD